MEGHLFWALKLAGVPAQEEQPMDCLSKESERQAWQDLCRRQVSKMLKLLHSSIQLWSIRQAMQGGYVGDYASKPLYWIKVGKLE